MKIPAILSLFSLPLIAGEMRDITTHEQLSQRLRLSERHDPMKQLQVVEGDDPTAASRPKDLLATSEVLCFNGIATLVPKGSVLAVPAALRARMSYQPGARLVPWHEFFAVNRGWVTTSEVTFEQAAGRAPLSEWTREQVEKTTVVMIATMRQGPISVNPYEQPAEAEAAPTAAR